MKYEYKILEETDTFRFNLSDINKLAADGWRVTTWIISDGGYETVLLEKIINNGKK